MTVLSDDRQFSSCDETGLKRSASYPLINSETFQLVNNEGEFNNIIQPAEYNRSRIIKKSI